MLTDQQIEQIKQDLKEVIFDIETQKFFESYNHLVAFMSNIKIWDETNFYVAINAVYGWMPRIIRIHDNVNECLDILNQQNKDFDFKKIERLAKTIDHSIVAVSKLLHFAYPNKYVIYDSRVEKFLKKIKFPFVKNKAENYLIYCQFCQELTCHPEIKAILSKKKFGTVTDLRKIEVSFYQNGGSNG